MKTLRKVLLTNSHADLGGGELALLAHIRHLRQLDVSISVYLLDHGPLEQEIENLGGRVSVSSFAWQGNRLRSSLLILRRVFDLFRCMRAERPDVVVAYTYNDFVFSALAARLAGCPLVYRAQGEVFPDEHPGGGGWLQKYFPAFVRIVRPRILCTTNYEAHNMVRSGVPAARVTTVPLGVERNTFDTDGPTMNARPVFGIFGRLARWKGQDTFVRAMGELARRGIDFEAWIVGGSSFGDGDAYERELADQIDAQGLNGRVRLLGFRRDVPELMSRCDVVCHCSDFEPFGLVIVEAMMAGKPVVASDVSGPRESIEPGRNGFLVPPRDPVSFADCLQRLAGDPELRERIGHCAKQHAQAHFDIERNLALLDDECRKLIRPKGRRAA